MKITTIGTYYNHSELGVIQITRTGKGGILFKDNYGRGYEFHETSFDKISEILLTDDWLIKLGFFNKTVPFVTRPILYYNKKFPFLEIQEGDVYGYVATYPYNIKMKYVHELQIFFQLATQENLEIQ